MPKINQEEYEVLKGLDDNKWKWIARDKDDTLVMGAGKNERYLDGWFPPENIGDSLVADEINAVKVISEWGNLFQFIKWEDEEPYNIQELIEEYLYDNQPKLFIDGQEQSFEFIEESEETEVKKDIEWAKKKIKEIHTLTFDSYEAAVIANNKHFQTKNSEQLALINKIMEILDQLDEPEVLSQEFIDEHLFSLGDKYPWKEAVPVGDLQNLLVPKQELPVIPNHVAKWISEHHERFDLYPALRRLENGSTRDYPTYKWYRENTLDFVVAYLTGEYEIEREPKYYAKIKGHENIGSNDKYWNYNTDMEELSIGDSEVHPNVISEYTIKATKDEWANLGINDDNADFVKVEELEE